MNHAWRAVGVFPVTALGKFHLDVKVCCGQAAGRRAERLWKEREELPCRWEDPQRADAPSRPQLRS